MCDSQEVMLGVGGGREQVADRIQMNALVLDIGLYFTLEHYSYLWHVCVCVRVRACVRAHAGVSMCIWVLFC